MNPLSAAALCFSHYVICSNGGGGTFYLSDINFDLINTYQVIQRDPEPLIGKLRQHAARHSKDYYYKIRSQHDLDDRVEIAARFIYLNKTCYNGLWRVNSRGEFNVPIGSYKNPSICQENVIRACHRALREVDIRLRDFRKLQAGPGDFVYFDPPYHPLDATSSFTSYARSGFGQDDQVALRDFCMQLHRRGVLLMLSNSDTPFMRSLYGSQVFNLAIVQAPRTVNCKGDSRGAVDELLVTNY